MPFSCMSAINTSSCVTLMLSVTKRDTAVKLTRVRVLPAGVVRVVLTGVGASGKALPKRSLRLRYYRNLR